MEAEGSGFVLPTAAILAAAAFLVAMLMVGLLAAFSRTSSLYRNGLLDPESLGGVLKGLLGAPRRFVLSVGTLYLGATAVSCLAAGRLLASARPELGGWRFYLPAAVAVVVVWTLTGLLVKRLTVGGSLGYVRVLGALMAPVNWLLRPWAALLGALGESDDTVWTAEATPHLSTGEIRGLIDDEEGGVNLEDDEREMIHSIFGFHETLVREIMVPRIDMFGLDVNTTVGEAFGLVSDSNHSRIPLHDGGIDRVTGLLYAKDLLALVRDGRLVDPQKRVGDLARPAYFIPESKKLDETLAELKAQRIHMAVVIDEYGGTAGLVTLEDILEEIVGEIEDEFDEVESLYEWLDDRTLRADARLDLDDLNDLVGLELPREGGETLGGLVYEAAGKVPTRGDTVTVAGLEMVVDSVEDQRILRVRIASPEPLPGYPAPGREG